VGLYLIKRDLGQATQEDVDAASIRALSCVYNYDRLRWVTSYWGEQAGIIYCLYEAQSEQQIIDHSAQSRIPCNEITPVQVVNPEEYAAQVPAVLRG
jgi:hypothetical protein